MNSIDSLFKLNDIRGIFPQELNEEIAFNIGKGLVKLLDCQTIAIGYDIRHSSEKLFHALASGIINNGCHVIDLGLISTDALYYLMGHEDYDCGIMITASHNPPQYNGFKICRKKAIMLYEDDGLNKLRELIISNQIDKEVARKGEIIKRDISKEFLEHVLSFIDVKNINNFYLGIDTSNGMAGVFIRDLLSRLPIRYEIINEKPDGSFPAHTPNSYNFKSWEQMKNFIKQKKLDFGVIFDGDADRISFLDDQGEYIDASVIAILLIKYYLQSNPSQAIVYDSVLSPLVEQTITQFNGIPIKSRIGHAFMKATMRKNNAIFGAEHTGHYYYRQHYYCDSGAITLLVMLEILSQIKQPLSILKKEINPHIVMPEIDYMKTDDYKEKIKDIEQYYHDTCSIDHFDGLIITAPDFRIHIHPANTGPFIRVNLEAINGDVFKEKEQELKNLFSKLNFRLF